MIRLSHAADDASGLRPARRAPTVPVRVSVTAADTGTIVVVMGVSGSGKTTVGDALAKRLRWVYQDGDDFHSAANRAKMQAGRPLNDTDRGPWLAAIAHWMDSRLYAGKSALIGCSALKRDYRARLLQGRPHVWFLYLRVERQELERRVSSRHHAYMPASLLDSQLETLQEPTVDEPRCLTLDAGEPLDKTVERALHQLHAAGLTRPAQRPTG